MDVGITLTHHVGGSGSTYDSVDGTGGNVTVSEVNGKKVYTATNIKLVSTRGPEEINVSFRITKDN